jgi:hypothetical protein
MSEPYPTGRTSPRPARVWSGRAPSTVKKLALVDALMDIDWMSWAEAKEAIPPAYTEYLGVELLTHLTARAA